MLLTIIYVSLYLLTASFFFQSPQLLKKYRKTLMLSHAFSLLLLILDLFWINVRGAWPDRIIVLTFLTTGSAIFSLYRQKLRPLTKCYFGLFFAYPIVCLVIHFMDKIFFVIVASPLIATLIIPQNVFSNEDYDIREQVGLLAPKRLLLIEKGLITERTIGVCSDEEVVHLAISKMEIKTQTPDTIYVMITTRDSISQAVFTK